MLEFNKEKLISDLENLYNIIMTLLVIFWLFSGFGLAIAGQLYSDGHNITSYVIIILDVIILFACLFNRYFKK